MPLGGPLTALQRGYLYSFFGKLFRRERASWRSSAGILCAQADNGYFEFVGVKQLLNSHRYYAGKAGRVLDRFGAQDVEGASSEGSRCH